MTVQEMEMEFKFKYDSASNGGPDLNSYETSLCLTQAARDLISASYLSYETNEISKRVLSPFLTVKNFDNPTSTIDPFSGLMSYTLEYSDVDFSYRVRDRVKLKGCITNPKVIVIRKDNLQEYLNNPFKTPNERKVLREDLNETSVKIFSSIPLDKYQLEFIKRDKPIIIRDFDLDPTLMGDETIEGLNTESMTLIPEMYHDRIVNRAVQLAIVYTRENGLKNQSSV